MLHNAAARVVSGSSRMTRMGSFRVGVALAALAVMPAIVLAGPIPGLPDLPTPNPAPQPQPQPQPPPQPPAPGTDDSTYGSQGRQQTIKTTHSQTLPYAYSGPFGRVRLGGVWGYRSDRGDKGLRAGWGRGDWQGHHVRVPYVPNAWPVTGSKGV